MRRLVVLGVVALAVLALGTARLFVWPSAGSPTSADAVVIFAGGLGERLARAQLLMADGLASNLVIPNGTAPEWPAGNAACGENRPYAVFCPVPHPDTTRGEARAIADLAQNRGWTRVILVTSTYQVTRADLLLGRCFDGDVQRVRARPGLSAFAWLRRVGHELLAWTHAMTIERGC
jgi:uncharacterized SAM-binding protein YcdF (DUF218 family)